MILVEKHIPNPSTRLCLPVSAGNRVISSLDDCNVLSNGLPATSAAALLANSTKSILVKT